MSTPPPDAGAQPVIPPVPVASPEPVTPAEPPVAAGQPVVPPPARRSKLPWIIGGAALGFVLIVGITIAVVVSLVIGATRGPQDVVGAYDRAFDEVDCELYFSVTTEAYQESFTPTCEEFEATAQSFVEAYSDYKVTVTGSSISGDTATVETTETYVYGGESAADEYTYHLVKSDGDWLIDALDLN